MAKADAPTVDLDTLRSLAQIPASPQYRRAPRFGKLGHCAGCKTGIETHFTTDGAWIGCPGVASGTVFVLVPVAPPAGRVKIGMQVAVTGSEGNGQPKADKHRALRHRYYLNRKAVPKDATVASLNLGDSDHRKRVMRVLLKNVEAGWLARDIIEKSKLPHGSVQQVLSWLRNHDFIEAHEEPLPAKKVSTP